MNYLGIDIGSTCAKTVVLNDEMRIVNKFVVPTGWSSFDALERIEQELKKAGVPDPSYCVSTGYGRGAVSFAGNHVTEITCHAKGADFLFGDAPLCVLDIGGQDTKVIAETSGLVEEFYMNEKCSAGTGKFLEVMANRLEVPIGHLPDLAQHHTTDLKISSMCTVFAESEIISLSGKGESKENIAWGVLNSVARKAGSLLGRLKVSSRQVVLTGGLCDAECFLQILKDVTGRTVISHPDARYAGAIGAALIARRKAGAS